MDHCPPQRCRSFVCILHSILIVCLMGGDGILVAAINADRDRCDDRAERQAVRIDSAERHVAELAKLTHERRVILADELRKETTVAVADVRAELDRRVLLWGQHINEERTARRADVDRLSTETVVGAAMILREQEGRTKADAATLARLESIEARLKAIERPPAPPVPSKAPPATAP